MIWINYLLGMMNVINIVFNNSGVIVFLFGYSGSNIIFCLLVIGIILFFFVIIVMGFLVVIFVFMLVFVMVISFN